MVDGKPFSELSEVKKGGGFCRTCGACVFDSVSHGLRRGLTYFAPLALGLGEGIANDRRVLKALA